MHIKELALLVHVQSQCYRVLGERKSPLIFQSVKFRKVETLEKGQGNVLVLNVSLIIV
jgi:hypothetical protein